MYEGNFIPYFVTPSVIVHSNFLSSLEFPAQPGREASKSSKGEIINLPHRAYHHHLQHHLHLICLCLGGSYVGQEVEEEEEGRGGEEGRRDPPLIRDTRRGEEDE